MNDRRRVAFSLIEALIILVLISIAIMGLIPLMSKKVNYSRWKQSNYDSNAITFGTTVANRVGFGEANPYAPPYAKIAVNSLSIAEEPGTTTANSSVSIGYNITSSDVYNPYNPSESVVLGMNINAIPRKSLLVNPQKTPSIGDRGIDIANKIVLDADVFELKDGKNTFISLKSNNDFSINFPDGSIALKYVYANSKLTTNAHWEIGEDGISMLYLDSYGPDNTYKIASDKITCYDKNAQPYDGTNSISSFYKAFTLLRENLVDTCVKEDGGKFTNANDAGSCVVSGTEFFRNTPAKDGISESYCFSTKGKNFWTVSSDRRLKNIISDYKKGIKDLENIETYNFVYKNDKKKRVHTGVIAQRLKGIYDEALHTDEKGYLSYEKEPILYSMVNAVKEIFTVQNDFDKKQIKLKKKADKLIRMYE